MSSSYSAFLGARRIATGPLAEVARAAATALQTGNGAESLLVFHDETAFVTELDLRGSPDDAAARAVAGVDAPAPAPTPAPAPPRRGRPHMGVVAREITLLPRHWEWLGLQPGGASVALRKLVDEARRTHGTQDTVRAAQARAYRFLGPIAGHLPGYEEALRALFGGRQEAFEAAMATWPEDIQHYAKRLSNDAFTGN